MNFKKYHVSRNLCPITSFDKATDVYYTILFNTPIPTGTYTLGAKITSTSAESRISFRKAGMSQIIASNIVIQTGRSQLTVTLNEPCYGIYIYGGTTVIDNIPIKYESIMLNTGSTALPYEPYSSEVWRDTPHYIHNTSTDTITALPAALYPNASTATVGLKGQTVQSGTPTSDSPIMPDGCGELTGNLLPEFYAASGEISGNSYTITKNSIETHNNGSVLGTYYVLTEFRRYGNYANYAIIDEKHSFKIPAGTYTFSGNENIHSGDNGLRLIVGELGQAVAGATGGAKNIGVGQTFTINEDSYVCPVLEIRKDSRVDEYTLTNPMLNLGSTALPYEPYGYKIPISSAGQTTPVCLGEVETTRKVKKLVLTGEETWYMYSAGVVHQFYSSGLKISSIANTSAYSTIAPYGMTASNRNGDYGCYTVTSGTEIAFQMYGSKAEFPSQTEWKAYLAAQYAAGTPVCVWYVLATEETAVVNEPLMRIGDYADTLSNISIPITAGGDTLSVGTTVQPSEVTVNYKGWHPVQNVHEKSKNLFDKGKRTDNSRVVYTTGEIGALNGTFVSDFTPIEPNTTYTLNIVSSISGKTGHLFALYDENKDFVNTGAHEATSATVYTFTTPSNVAYIRFNGDMSSVDRTMLNSGNTALPYEPYWK